MFDLLDLALQVAHRGVFGNSRLKFGNEKGTRLADGLLVRRFHDLLASLWEKIDALASLLGLLLLPRFTGLNHADQN